jgi:hypothetical protein
MIGLLVAIASFGAVQDNSRDWPLLIQHVSAITCGKAGTLRDVDVLVMDGRIKAIAHHIDSSKLRWRDAAIVPTIIEGNGKFLIPGLWDMHVHGTASPGFTDLYLANGVTGIRDMFDPTGMTFKIRDSINAGKTQGPHIVAAGKIVDGKPPIWEGSVVATTAEEGEKAVDQVLKEGSDFVKVYSLLPRDAYFAIAHEAKTKHVAFEGHVPEVVSAEEASNAGQKSFEHLYGILKGCSSDRKLANTKILGGSPEQQSAYLKEILDTYDENRAQQLFKTLKKNKSWQCPTFTVLYSISHPKDPRTDMQFRFAYMPGWMKTFWAQYMDRYKSWTSEDADLRDKYFQKELGVVSGMYRAGVPIIAGTDVMNPYCFPGFSLHDELAWLVKAGMTPSDALKASTINAARFFGKEKDFGSVEHGKVADLVLLDRDPLEDIHNTTAINAVILRGKLLKREDLDKLMPKVAAQPSQQMPSFLGGIVDDEP